jgi:hypothetical protein
MLKVYLLYPHLLATCLAIGMILLTDLRLLAKVVGYQVVIPAPSRFETRVVSVALLALYVTGAGLMWLGWQERADYLSNPKLLAKLALVAALTLNGVFMHWVVFPRLEREAPVSSWRPRFRVLVSASVGLSNSVWLYAAFLGIARPWNFSKPFGEVLGVWFMAWALLVMGVSAMLRFAAVESPQGRKRWPHEVKERLSGFSGLSEFPSSQDTASQALVDVAPGRPRPTSASGRR